MHLALDAMGGDYAPREVVAGAVKAARELGVAILLVGAEDPVRSELARYDIAGLPLQIVPASEAIEMHEHPAMAVRQKKDSSIVVGMRLVRDHQAEAFISAGHSGAVMAAATLILGRLPGIARPALAAVFPGLHGPFLFTDAGANTDPHPEYLLQFAAMGSIYMEKVYGLASPRVALLSNGEEETKGDRRVQEAHAMFRQAAGLHFIGNIEPKEMFASAADVVVVDGFAGNLVLKCTEATADMLLRLLKEELTSKLWRRLPAALLRPAFRRVKARMDYSEYGGAPLLGLKGMVILGHGRSNAHAIYNALRVAREAVTQGVLTAMAEALEGLGQVLGAGRTEEAANV